MNFESRAGGSGASGPEERTFGKGPLSFEEKGFAALSYIWILFLVPLILKARDSRFVLFHLKQGIVLFVMEILSSILLWVLREIFLLIAPLKGLSLMQLLERFLFLFFVVISLIAIYQTFRGKEWKIPWLHRFAQLIKI